ncbi:DUF885 family protein [Shewanella sp. NIFS-20-20]|uniref:DUF885 domain-containing protein n=1 Tax=Shewanella sp. NIFS-20-20 TaxID=2853806 RepID=UPI001C48D0CC|nr:DUF885 domain-containing protein [Shewanella sp. NIFS-20-20]MBV7316104.1 DUF885 domain-containing protein [Shewanella sp. NIFS-20-20]
MSKLAVILLTLLGIGGCQHQASLTHIAPAETSVSQPSPASMQLQQLIDQDWQLKLARYPYLAERQGVANAAARLVDMSSTALADYQAQQLAMLNALNNLDSASLSHQDKINAQILTYQLQDSTDMYRFGDHYMPITAEGGFHTSISQISDITISNEADAQAYFARLNALPTYFKQQTLWLQQGLALGITPPRVTLKGIEDTVSAYQVDVNESTYYQPFTQLPASMPAEQQAQLQQQAQQLIQDKVLPLYDDFYWFLTEQYLPQTRTSIAASDMPDGVEFYENRIKHYTTLNMTSEQVHQLGLLEVARIRAEMQAVIEELAFQGSFDDFLHFLRTDPQFYAKTPQELLKHAAYIAKQADAVLPKYFATLPRTPYGIKEVPAQIAPKYTTGRYSGASNDTEAGYYWVNTYALDKRPLYEMEALTLHEAVPGHHLQIALNQEQADLPNFRRYSYISAFGEGWGLYAEYLGIEAGFYQDPYSNFGRLTYEMWRAVRLVVDTGLHMQGWSRQQAIDYMASNTALSLHNVTTEIDRYISWPGQAVSYKIGELTIKRLRQQAQYALGDKFDIRQFHDAVLINGSVPLSILEQQVKAYIERVNQA